MLDELKGVAILLVVLYHAGGVLVWNNYLHGDLGVDIFVILSGLGLAMSSRYGGAREFLTRRLWRIMPAYWIALDGLSRGAEPIFLQHPCPSTTWSCISLGIHAWLGTPMRSASATPSGSSR